MTVIFTHNPQDFFEGIEAPELNEIKRVSIEELQEVLEPMLNEGYKAIIIGDHTRGD